MRKRSVNRMLTVMLSSVMLTTQMTTPMISFAAPDNTDVIETLTEENEEEVEFDYIGDTPEEYEEIFDNDDSEGEYGIIDNSGKNEKDYSGYRIDGRYIAPELLKNLDISDERIFSSAYTDLIDEGVTKGFSAFSACPSKGIVHPLIIMVDFSDTAFSDGFNKKYVNDLFFGSVYNYPYESVSAWYKRSSYGKLQFSGDENDIFEIHMEKGRDEYSVDGDHIDLNSDVYKQALEQLEDKDRYDADDNGVIDALCIIYAGEATKWGSEWWSCIYAINSDGEDNAQAFAHVMESQAVGQTNGASTIIHEFGHLLGLPDLYDTSNDFDQLSRAIHTADMMSDLTGDFNAFCKILLGWIDVDNIQIVSKSSDRTKVSLNGFTSDGECAIIFPDDADSLFGEYFIIQYEDLTQNGKAYYGAEDADTFVRIYHVNAEQNDGGGFKYSNSNDGKCNLVTVVDKDSYVVHGSDRDFGYKNMSESRYTCNFFEGDFTPYTAPSTALYSPDGKIDGHGEFSGINICDISITNDKKSVSFDVFYEDAPDTSKEKLFFEPAAKWNAEKEEDFLHSETDNPTFYLKANHDFYIENEEMKGYLRMAGEDKAGDVLCSLETWDGREYQNNFVMLVSYEGELKADTEYELVFPEGMFRTVYGQISEEIVVGGIHTDGSGNFGETTIFEKSGYQPIDDGSYAMESCYQIYNVISDGEKLIIPYNKSGTGLVACTINGKTGELVDENVLISDTKPMTEQQDTYSCGYFGQTQNGRYVFIGYKLSEQLEKIYIKVFDGDFRELYSYIWPWQGIYNHSPALSISVNGNRVGFGGGLLDTEVLKVYELGTEKMWDMIYPLKEGTLLQERAEWDGQGTFYLLNDELKAIKEISGLDKIIPQYIGECEEGYIILGTENNDMVKYVLGEDYTIRNRCVLYKNRSLRKVYALNSGFLLVHNTLEGEHTRSTFYDCSLHIKNDLDAFDGVIAHIAEKDYLCSLKGDGYVYNTDTPRLEIKYSSEVNIPASKHEYGDDIKDTDTGRITRICSICGDEWIVSGAEQEETVKATGISVDPVELNLSEEETVTLIVKMIPEEAVEQKVVFSSSDENVANVGENGRVTAIEPGTATITATTEDGELTATCVVTVSKKTEITQNTFSLEQAAKGVPVINNRDYTLKIELNEKGGITSAVIVGSDGKAAKDIDSYLANIVTEYEADGKTPKTFYTLVFSDGKWDTSYDSGQKGAYQYMGVEYFVAGGVVNQNANGLIYTGAAGWRFLAAGHVVTDNEGLVMYANEWFWIDAKGRCDDTYAAIVKWNGSNFLVHGGRLRTDYTGFTYDPQNTAKWYHITAGQVWGDGEITDQSIEGGEITRNVVNGEVQ